jgi:hypothetical protein
MSKKIVALVAILVVAGVLAPSALALDPLGPPAAGLGKGNWGIGVDYSYSQMTFERIPTTWSSAKTTVGTKMHKVYGNIGYGLSENVDAFVRLGGANLEWARIPSRSYDWKGEDGDWDIVWGGGIKATLSESADVSWGILAQFSEGDLTGSQKTSDGYEGGYKIKLQEMQIAAGPTWKASDSVKLYGGPFVHLIRGKWNDVTWDDKHLKPIEQESWLGAYIGAAIELSSNTQFTVEYQYTADAYAVAGGLCWKF